MPKHKQRRKVPSQPCASNVAAQMLVIFPPIYLYPPTAAREGATAHPHGSKRAVGVIALVECVIEDPEEGEVIVDMKSHIQVGHRVAAHRLRQVRFGETGDAGETKQRTNFAGVQSGVPCDRLALCNEAMNGSYAAQRLLTEISRTRQSRLALPGSAS
jgi:hypothetical protein